MISRERKGRNQRAYGVEGSGIDGLVDLVRAGDTVGREKRDNLERREIAGVRKAGKDLVNAVLRLRYETIDGGDGVVRAAGHELEAGRARAVGQRNGTRKLDEIASADRRVLSEEGDQVVDAVVDTVVGLKVGLDGREQEHGAVGSTTTVNQIQDSCQFVDLKYAYALGPWLWLMAMASWNVRRMASWAVENDVSIISCLTGCNITIFTALVLEDSLLQVLSERDERAAGPVRNAGAVRADSSLRGRGSTNGGSSESDESEK
jgi:hypothetical protein